MQNLALSQFANDCHKIKSSCIFMDSIMYFFEQYLVQKPLNRKLRDNYELAEI